MGKAKKMQQPKEFEKRGSAFVGRGTLMSMGVYGKVLIIAPNDQQLHNICAAFFGEVTDPAMYKGTAVVHESLVSKDGNVEPPKNATARSDGVLVDKQEGV